MDQSYINSVLKEINVDEIMFADYQRSVKKDRVLSIVQNFDPHRMRPIDVSYRDGKYYCFDGQHRTTAYRLMGKKSIPAIVHYGCDYRREAMLFVNQSENVGKINNRDRWKAEWLAGKLDVTVIIRICEKYGYKVAQHGGNPAHTIQCIGSLRKIMNEQGEDGLEWIIRLIHKCWDGLPHAMSCDIIDGIANIKKTYGGNIDDKRLETILKKSTPDLVIRDSGIYRIGGYGGKNKSGFPVAKTIVGMYNKKLSVDSDKRLVDNYTGW